MVFNCRGSESIFRLGLTSNRYSLYAFAAGVSLLALVIFIPGLHSVFSIAALAYDSTRSDRRALSATDRADTDNENHQI